GRGWAPPASSLRRVSHSSGSGIGFHPRGSTVHRFPKGGDRRGSFWTKWSTGPRRRPWHRESRRAQKGFRTGRRPGTATAARRLLARHELANLPAAHHAKEAAEPAQ